MHIERKLQRKNRDRIDPQHTRLFALLVLRRTLRLRRASELLGSVFPLLALLPARLLNFRRLSVSHESVVRFELLHRLATVVDEREASALAATILCPEAKAGDLVLGGLIEFAKFGAELVFAHVCTVGVEDINDHLLAAQEGVADELARAQGHL